MIIEQTHIPGSIFDELIKHLYVPNRNRNLSALNALSAALLKANIKPNLLSNKALKQHLFHAQPDILFSVPHHELHLILDRQANRLQLGFHRVSENLNKPGKVSPLNA